MCSFDDTAVAGRGKVWHVNQVNHTRWVAVVTPTDVPKSVRNRSVSELFCGVVLSLCPFDVSSGVGAFVKGLSQISFFFGRSPKAVDISQGVEFIGVLHHMQRYFSHMCDGTGVQAD